MLKIENAEVMGWEHAIRGMRNPKNSWNASDSIFVDGDVYYNIRGAEPGDEDIREFDENHYQDVMIGENDLNLMSRLCKAGADHRKFMRMITVYLDITGPFYWWKEFDTYKVGTVANSCSTMHKLTAKEFALDDFSHDHLNVAGTNILTQIVETLNLLREAYLGNEIKGPEWKKDIWYMMIQLLPSSYNQKRTVMLNYEVLANIYKSRRNHKLDEWHTLCDWIESLPYSELITGKTKEESK